MSRRAHHHPGEGGSVKKFKDIRCVIILSEGDAGAKEEITISGTLLSLAGSAHELIAKEVGSCAAKAYRNIRELKGVGNE